MITINMIIEERPKKFFLPLDLILLDASFVHFRFMLNIPRDFEVVFERHPHWGSQYIALQPGDTNSSNACTSTRERRWNLT
jgi:hypothetical protein